MAQTMKAAYIKQPGPPENIIYGDFPKPGTKSNQVLVKVKAVTVNHIDTYIRSGQYKSFTPLPLVMGMDLTGVVESTGKDAKKFKPGQRVWSINAGRHGFQGSFGEYLAIDEDYLYPLPNNVDDKDAVAVLQGSVTALTGLIRIAKLLANETIFINGGAGSVGSAIIQFAHARGAKVIATAGSDEKVKWCKSIGADHAINYKTQKVEEEVKKAAPDGVNVFWDTTREPNFDSAVSVLAPRGRIILMAGAQTRSSFTLGPFYNKECALLGFTINRDTPEEISGYADIINKAFEEKKLVYKINKVFPLSDAANAHKLVETEKNLWGKVVLTV